MKKIIIILAALLTSVCTIGQELPDDVEKVFENAEKLQNKGKWDMAIAEYKQVLRSVAHVPSMKAIGLIQLELRPGPNYREAYEYLDMAINTLQAGKNATDKNKVKKYLQSQIDELVPKRNKAKSYVDQFDNAKGQKNDGRRLLEE